MSVIGFDSSESGLRKELGSVPISAKRSYNVHEEPRHNDGKPHVDIRRRGGYEERNYDLKEGE